jgi:hypothetical protein
MDPKLQMNTVVARLKYALFLAAFTSTGASASDTTLIKKRVIGTFHQRNVQHNGLSFGFASTMADSMNGKTNGLRLEVPGIGMISFMGNGFPNATEPFDLTNFKYSEVINGLNISSGSWCECNYNGLTIGLVGQFGVLGNGLSLAGGWNIIDKQNGLQVSMLANSSYYMNGVQIAAYNFANTGKGLQVGIRNKSKKFKGVQIGIWNTNEKRSLPIVNWNFGKQAKAI